MRIRVFGGCSWWEFGEAKPNLPATCQQNSCAVNILDFSCFSINREASGHRLELFTNIDQLIKSNNRELRYEAFYSRRFVTKTGSVWCVNWLAPVLKQIACRLESFLEAERNFYPAGGEGLGSFAAVQGLPFVARIELHRSNPRDYEGHVSSLPTVGRVVYTYHR